MDDLTSPFELRTRRIEVGADGVTLSFSYGLGSDTFTERFVVSDGPDPVGSPDDPAIEHLLDVAQLCVGVSYFKLTMPDTIRCDRPLAPVVAALVPHLYDHGLRELAVRNDLPVPVPVRLDGPLASSGTDGFAAPTVDHGPLVPFGGGKDSTLALTLLDQPTTISIHPTDVQRRVARAAGVRLVGVDRTLDPLLAVRTAEGGLNGHVPITAINSSISAVLARLWGHREVVMANERSAEEPTRFVGDHVVNHQYSKTLAFEAVLADALRPAHIEYYSLVRRWSELAIAGALAPHRDLRVQILSCNRAFSLNRPSPDPTWCLDCAKCRFTYLGFANFLERDEMIEMFGHDLLDDATQIDGVRALWSDKPFDCVGELAESAIALATLADRAPWSDVAVVRALADEARTVADGSGTSWRALLEPRGADRVPEARRSRLEDALTGPARRWFDAAR